MNVLAIGNSFSEDSTRYLHRIARKDGVNLQVVNLFIGGCSLERHYRNMLSGDREYELQCNGERTGFKISLKEALLNRKWDVVTMQQASHLSFNEETYFPYITELAEYVRKLCPKVKIYIHETWAYEEGSPRLFNVAKYETSAKMLEDAVLAYKKVAQSIDAYGIIPSGEMFAKLIDNGIERVHRDTFHASFGVGRYALALLWYHTLCKMDVTNNAFCDFDEEVSSEEIRIVKSCVNSY